MTSLKFFNQLFIVSASAFTFGGCCGYICKPEIRYVDRTTEVKVPIVVPIVKPEKPTVGINLSDTLLNIKGYIMKYNEKVDINNNASKKDITSIPLQ